MVAWGRVTRSDVLRAIREYDRLGAGQFFTAHGFAPTTTYELVWDELRYPPKAIWAPLMSSQRASNFAPVTSRAARAAP